MKRQLRPETSRRTSRRFARRPVSVAVLLLLASAGTHALPTGGQVVSGEATIQTPAAGQQLVTQGTQRAIIDWNSFSIGSGETVRFAQPASTSLVLNRVTGYDPSRILGQLQANGRVFLLNPYGVVFGAGARVDASALVASTLNLSNADFLAGLYRFDSNDGIAASRRGAVVNEGTIATPGGTVALIGPQVSNRGTIDAPLGRVGLAAADQVLVDVDGGGLVLFQVAGTQATNKLEQLGQIRADGGSVDLHAAARAALTDTVLNLDGVVQARSLGVRQGRVVIDGGDAGVTRVAGTVDVSGRSAGEQGGRAEVLGHDVLVDSTARIDASGAAGGGMVRIGGDWQGQGELRHADQTIVAAGAQIDASALALGGGGSVAVWSDSFTQFFGAIAARGGAQGGDGGRVETSGHAFLTAAGSVDASAPFGRNGEWLLDPFNVTIGNANTDSGVQSGTTFTANTNGTSIKASDIEGALAGGTNVTVSTGTSGTQAGNISVATNIQPAVGAGKTSTLTLSAAGSISIGNGDQIAPSSGSLNVNLYAGVSDQSNAQASAGSVASTISFGNASSEINTAGGDLTMIAQGNITIEKLTNVANLDVDNKATGTITLNQGITTTGNQTYRGAVAVGSATTLAAGAGKIDLRGTFTATSDNLTLTSTNSAADAIHFGGAVTGVAALAVNGKSTIGADITTSGNQSFSDAITLGADATLDAGAGTIALTSLDGAGHGLALTSSNAAASAIANSGAISGVSTLAVNGKSTLGGDVTTTGNQTYTGLVTLNKALETLDAGSAKVDLQAGVAGGTNALAVTTTSTAADAIKASGNLSAAGIALGAPLTLGADAVLDAGSGLLALGGAVAGASHALQLTSTNSAANAVDVQAVSGVTSFTVTGKSTLHGNVTSSGQQTYSDAVTLGTDVAFDGVGVDFQGTLDGAHAASVTAGTGAAAFGANVGAGSALTQLAVTADTISFAGTVTGAGGATALLAPFSAAQGVSIAGGVTSDATPLVIDNTMLALFTGFGSLTLGSASGSAGIGVGALSLPTATTVRSGSGNITFSTVDGAKALTVNTGGTTTFAGTVGGGTALASLTTDAPGTTHIGAAITTSGAQTFNDPVVLDASVTLAGASVTFGSTLAGLTGGESLAVDSTGVTRFGGNVTQLATLTTDAAGSTEFGANVTTSGTQTYNDKVSLTADATLTAPTINFGGDVALASFELDLNADVVGFPVTPLFTGTGTLGLAPYSASTTIGIAGGAGTFQVPQTLLDSFTTLSALAIGRADGSGAVSVGVAGGVPMTLPTALTLRTGSAPLDVNVNVTGTTPFSIASSGGPIGLNGITVDTGAASQSYNGPVVLRANPVTLSTQTQLNGGDITLAGSVDAAVAGSNSLVIDASGVARLLGNVGSGGALGSLWSQNGAGSNELGGNVTASGFIEFDGAAHLVADATLASFTDVAFLGTLDGAHALTLSAPTTYLAASIGGTDPLTSLTVPGAVQLLGNVAASGGTLSFTGGVSGPGWLFAPDASVATRLAGSVSVGSFSATGPAVLLGNTTVSASSIAFGSTIDGAFVLGLNSPGTTTLGGAVGSTTPLAGLTTDAGGTTHLGANVSASGALGFGDAVVVDANATLAAGLAGVSFASTVDGPGALVVNTGGATTFAGAAGSITALGGLTTDAGGSTSTHGVTASGAITFNDIASLAGTYATGGANFTATQAVTLTAATAIGTGAGNAGFGSSVDGAFALSVDSSGATSFAGNVGGAVALASLTTDAGGTTALNGNVFTSGAQHYGDAVTLAGDRFLLGSSLAFDAALALGSGNVVLAADTMSFGPTLSGSGTLVVEPLNAGTTIGLAGGAGTLQLTSAMLGQLGGLSALTIGNSADSGTITAGALALPTATTIVSGSGDIDFGAITGAHSLDVQTGGVTRFGGTVSGPTALTTDLFGSTQLGAAITVAGPVTFADPVTLIGASSVTGTSVDFGNTVDGGFALAATGSTQVRFDAAVGGVTALGSLSTGGSTRLAGNVTTSGPQSYQGALTLVAASTALTGTDITFGSTVDGATADANALTINASGIAALQGDVGATTRLASLYSTSGGSATIGGNISAAGIVQFNDPASLTADATLTSATNYVAFVAPLDGAHALTTSAGTFSWFGSTVGATTPLASLTTQGTDVYVSFAQANNAITTAGAQTYQGIVHLYNSTAFSGSTLAFLGGVDGAGWAFTTNGTSATQLTGSVNVGTLAASGPVQLVGDTTVTAALASFGSTVDGAFALTANVGGTTTFSAPVGATTPLTSLTVLGDAQLDGGSFTTSGAQSYQQAVSLGADSTFTATTLQLGGTTLAINNHELDLHVDSFTLASSITGGVSISLAPASAATAISIAFAGGTADPTDFEVPQTTVDQFSGFNLVKIGRADGTGAIAVSNLTLPTNLRLQSGSGNVTLQGSVDTAATAMQPSDLTIATGGTTTVSGPIGATRALGTLDITGAAQLSGGSLIAANGLVFEAGFGANAGAVDFVTDALSVTGPVSASADLSFAPYTAASGIGVAGGAGALQLPQSLLDQFTGAASLTIGRVDGSGPIELGAFVVPTATRLQSGSGDVAFTGAVDSAAGTPRDLTVATGGTTTLPAQLGATRPLGSFSVTGASALGADTTLTAATIGFGADVSGPHALTLDGALRLAGDLAISGTDVHFQTIDGAFGLTVNASGTTTFAGPVGATTALASLTTDAAGTTHLAGSMRSSGAIRFNDAVVLDADASLTAGAVPPGADSVLFAQAVDGGFALAVSSAGTTHFEGAVGAATPLASLTSSGTGLVQFDQPSVTTTGAQSYAGAVQLPDGATLQGASLDLAGGGSAGVGLTLLTESLALGAPLVGSGQIAIAPRHAGDSIGLGSAAGTLAIGQSVLDRLGGFAQLLVGRADGTGDLTAQNVMLPMATTLQSGSGEIRLAGVVDGAVDLTLATGGVTSLAGGIGTGVALSSLHVTDDAAHADWDGSAGERTLLEGGAPVRIVTSGVQVYQEPLLASTALSLQADSVQLAQAVGALTLGDVRLANGGGIASSGVLQLAGALQLDAGTLTLTSTATPTAGAITDPEYAGKSLLFRVALLQENSATIEQLSGSTIRTAAGSLLALRAPNNGSILLEQPGNQLAGGLSAVSGTPGDNEVARFNVAGSLALGVVRIAADEVNVAGRFNGDATLADLGIEADAVHITADRLGTGAGGLIRARLPFDNTQGSQTSLPALTLGLTPGTYTLTGPYGSGASPASWIQVKLGDIDGGFVTLRPKGDAVTHPDLFVFLAGDPQPRPFYDGSGKTSEIPIFYNGDTPRTPQEVGALNAVTAVVENARRARFEEAVRTENVTSRLRQGVIAEVGAGRPATEGSGTMRMPEGCPVKPGKLECQ